MTYFALTGNVTLVRRGNNKIFSICCLSYFWHFIYKINKKVIVNLKNGSFVAAYDPFVAIDEPLQHISDML